MSSDIKITIDDIKKFRIGFAIEENQPIKSIDFSPDGQVALFNTEVFIKLVQLAEPLPTVKKIEVHKHRVGISKFMSNNRVIHTSAVDNTMKLLDVSRDSEQFNYISYFPGHSKEVHSLTVSKASEVSFASASRDRSIRFWDTRKVKEIFMKKFDEIPFVAYHPLGHLIAVIYNNSLQTYSIDIFDFRKNSFVKKFDVEIEFDVTHVRYSNDGKFLMINTVDSLILTIDVNNEEIVQTLRGFKTDPSSEIHSCFTPDSKFVLSGSEDGIIHVWNLRTSAKELKLRSETEQSFNKIEFNSQLMCIATANWKKFHLWIENDLNNDEEDEGFSGH